MSATLDKLVEQRLDYGRGRWQPVAALARDAQKFLESMAARRRFDKGNDVCLDLRGELASRDRPICMMPFATPRRAAAGQGRP